MRQGLGNETLGFSGPETGACQILKGLGKGLAGAWQGLGRGLARILNPQTNRSDFTWASIIVPDTIKKRPHGTHNLSPSIFETFVFFFFF